MTDGRREQKLATDPPQGRRASPPEADEPTQTCTDTLARPAESGTRDAENRRENLLLTLGTGSRSIKIKRACFCRFFLLCPVLSHLDCFTVYLSKRAVGLSESFPDPTPANAPDRLPPSEPFERVHRKSDLSRSPHQLEGP